MSIKTRGKFSKLFAGVPCPLDKTEPPTLRQVIQYSYFLENTYPDWEHGSIGDLIAKDIIDIWQMVNQRLPLFTEHYIKKKVKTSCLNARKINWKSLAASTVKSMTAKLDRLFDIPYTGFKTDIP